MKEQLSKKADKLLCMFYKTYLQRRKDGIPKTDAAFFESTWTSDLFPNEAEDDLLIAFAELCHAKYIRSYIEASFDLENTAIIYMENRFPDGLKTLLEYIGKIAAIFS